LSGGVDGRIVGPTDHEEETRADPRKLVLDELRKAGANEHVERALQELPETIDHNEHAALLEKFGLDPGKLAEKAARHELGET
jgi:5-methylcytosine-specific restriction endonuclease McrBC GTP-binding regulatory subunit McrB